MENAILKAFLNGQQYNLIRENGIFKVYYDFGRVAFEILTDNEKNAVETFKNYFGKNATFEKFCFGFGNQQQ